MHIGIPYPPVGNQHGNHGISPPFQLLPSPQISLQHPPHYLQPQSPTLSKSYTSLKEITTTSVFGLQTVDADFTPAASRVQESHKSDRNNTSPDTQSPSGQPTHPFFPILTPLPPVLKATIKSTVRWLHLADAKVERFLTSTTNHRTEQWPPDSSRDTPHPASPLPVKPLSSSTPSIVSVLSPASLASPPTLDGQFALSVERSPDTSLDAPRHDSSLQAKPLSAPPTFIPGDSHSSPLAVERSPNTSLGPPRHDSLLQAETLSAPPTFIPGHLSQPSRLAGRSVHSAPTVQQPLDAINTLRHAIPPLTAPSYLPSSLNPSDSSHLSSPLVLAPFEQPTLTVQRLSETHHDIYIHAGLPLSEPSSFTPLTSPQISSLQSLHNSFSLLSSQTRSPSKLLLAKPSPPQQETSESYHPSPLLSSSLTSKFQDFPTGSSARKYPNPTQPSSRSHSRLVHSSSVLRRYGVRVLPSRATVYSTHHCGTHKRLTTVLACFLFLKGPPSLPHLPITTSQLALSSSSSHRPPLPTLPPEATVPTLPTLTDQLPTHHHPANTNPSLPSSVIQAPPHTNITSLLSPSQFLGNLSQSPTIIPIRSKSPCSTTAQSACPGVNQVRLDCVSLECAKGTGKLSRGTSGIVTQTLVHPMSSQRLQPGSSPKSRNSSNIKSTHLSVTSPSFTEELATNRSSTTYTSTVTTTSTMPTSLPETANGSTDAPHPTIETNHSPKPHIVRFNIPTTPETVSHDRPDLPSTTPMKSLTEKTDSFHPSQQGQTQVFHHRMHPSTVKNPNKRLAENSPNISP